MRLVGFHGLTMASMKMMAFWQLIALIMEVVPCTSEMLVYFTETTQCYIPEGCHLQNVTSFDFYRNEKKMLHQSIMFAFLSGYGPLLGCYEHVIFHVVYLRSLRGPQSMRISMSCCVCVCVCVKVCDSCQFLIESLCWTLSIV
jgi:hypothetical protein